MPSRKLRFLPKLVRAGFGVVSRTLQPGTPEESGESLLEPRPQSSERVPPKVFFGYWGYSGGPGDRGARGARRLFPDSFQTLSGFRARRARESPLEAGRIKSPDLHLQRRCRSGESSPVTVGCSLLFISGCLNLHLATRTTMRAETITY